MGLFQWSDSNGSASVDTMAVQLIKETIMSVAKVTEIISSSSKSFDDAVEKGVERASKTLNGITSAWIKDQSVVVEKGKIAEYRVNMAVTFVLADAKDSGKTGGRKKKKKK